MAVGGVLESNYPFADTEAAMALRAALDRAHRERNLSIRSLGKQLGYKQATVLSHMASGRVAIPLERAPEIARAVGLDQACFVAACLAQRAPEAAELLTSSAEHRHDGSGMSLVAELKLIADRPLDKLNDEQKGVLREVVRDPSPRPRWLTPAELPLVALVRQLRPSFARDGLQGADWKKIEAALGFD